MITPFSLPSDPSIVIQLREATVADAIDFADVDESHEEELTTMFLARMLQTAGTIRDPREWTDADRRFALYWYWLHTAKDTEVALSYECQHCGQKHVYLQRLRELADNYTPINGSARRPGKWKDEEIIVRPLSGWDMEALERMRLGLGDEGGERKKRLASMMIERLVMIVAFAGDKDQDRAMRAENTRQRLMSMPLSEFTEFADMVYGLAAEMRHGLDMEYDEGRLHLLMPPHTCPERGEQTRLRYPFRNNDYIPGL